VTLFSKIYISAVISYFRESNMQEIKIPTLDGRVSYSENPIYAITKALRAKGYDIARHNGLRVQEPEEGGIGILKGGSPIPGGILDMRGNRDRGLWIGRVHTANRSNWVLEVYGREYVPELSKLFMELSAPSQACLQVRLERETPDKESLSRDFTPD
jgi:hypothetical protein